MAVEETGRRFVVTVGNETFGTWREESAAIEVAERVTRDLGLTADVRELHPEKTAAAILSLWAPPTFRGRPVETKPPKVSRAARRANGQASLIAEMNEPVRTPVVSLESDPFVIDVSMIDDVPQPGRRIHRAGW